MLSIAVLKLAAVSSLLAATICSAELATRSMTHNGYNRPCLTYRPAHLPVRPPVVFMLEGISQNVMFLLLCAG